MNIRNTLLPIAGAALLLVGLTANAQAEEQCLNQRWVGTAEALLKGIAIRAARGDWSNRVRANIHLAYSQWGLAEDKEETCTGPGPNNRYRCRVEATPCEWVVG